MLEKIIIALHKAYPLSSIPYSIESNSCAIFIEFFDKEGNKIRIKIEKGNIYFRRRLKFFHTRKSRGYKIRFKKKNVKFAFFQ